MTRKKAKIFKKNPEVFFNPAPQFDNFKARQLERSSNFVADF